MEDARRIASSLRGHRELPVGPGWIRLEFPPVMVHGEVVGVEVSWSYRWPRPLLERERARSSFRRAFIFAIRSPTGISKRSADWAW